MSASVYTETPIEVKTQIRQIAGRPFEVSYITPRCITLRSVKTGKVSQFDSLEALGVFVRGLADYLKRKDAS